MLDHFLAIANSRVGMAQDKFVLNRSLGLYSAISGI
jgi:hypothetical protein